MKIVFFGTSQFAVPALKKLTASDFEVAAVVTQPDKPVGRKQELFPSPVKVAAERLGLKVLQPESLQATSYKLQADLFIVASYGKIIPKSLLDIPKYGALNIHPSLLPKYRGPSPIHAAILNGDTETGVTIMKLDEEMDHGDVVTQSILPLSPSPLAGEGRGEGYELPRFKNLHDKLAEMGAKLLIEILPDYLAGKIKPKPQDHSKATYIKIITRDDARINWQDSAQKIDRQIRAYSSWPVAWTTLDGKRLKIYEAVPLPVIPANEPESREWIPGQARDDKKPGKLFVQCGAGILEIIELQLEGGRRLTASEFLRGHPELNTKVFV